MSRLANVAAETAPSCASAKFERCFRRVEALLAERGATPEKFTLAEMDALWDTMKRDERNKTGGNA
jgi:ATP diphosphatase